MRQFLKPLALAAVLAAATATAQAQNTGVYIGGEFGSSKVSNVSRETGAGIFAGYDFTDNVAAEFGYRKNGTYQCGLVDYDAIALYDCKLTSYDLSALIGGYVAPNVKLYGRVGYTRAELEGSYLGVDTKDTENSPIIGFGVRYSATPNLGVRAEYTHVTDVFDEKVDTVKVGVEYKF